MKDKKTRDFTRLAQEDKAIRGGIVNGNLIYIIVFLVKICVILWLVTPAAAQLADSPWPMFHHDLNHTGLSSNYGPDTSALKWTFSTGDRIFGSAAIAEDGTIYIGTRKCAFTWGSNLYAIYPNGTEKWHWSPYRAVDFIDSTPAVASDGTIYAGSWDRCLYAFYPNGTKKWKFCAHLGGFVLTSPAIAPDGTIYIGNKNRKLYAINPDGSLKWAFATGTSIQSSPAIGHDGTIYVGSNDKKLYAIYPDGTLKWSYHTGGRVKSSPAIDADGIIYVGSNDRKLYAIYPDGTLKWSYTTCGNIISSPAIDADGIIYVGSNDGKLYAIYPDGTLKWSYQTGGRVESSPVVDEDGTVYVGSHDKHIYAINPDGTLLWKYYTGDNIFYSSPAIASDGTVYIGNWGGKLYAFGPGQAPCEPSIEVNKTVWNGTAWAEKIEYVNINQTYRFRCEVQNNGTCCNLTDIKVVDNLSNSLEYKNNATVDGILQEPDWQSDNQFGWNFTGPLSPSQRIVIEFDANVTGCGNDSNVQNATAYCAETDKWVSDEDYAWVNVSDGTDCGSDYYDSYVNYCKGEEVWKHRQFHDFYCEAGTCTDHTSWVDDTFVENCSDSDGWYNTTNTRWVDDTECTEKEQQEQEYRDYTCSGGDCTFSVTSTQWVDTGAVRNKADGTDCGSDYYDAYVNYCKGEEVWKHRLFHDFYCEAGTCTDHTSWVDDTFVENCSDSDGWYNTTNTRWVDDTECTEKEQQEQEYRDYTCSGGDCTFSVTSTRWVDTGAVRNKPDGTICGYGDWEDDPTDPGKERRQIYVCVSGTCTPDGYEYRDKGISIAVEPDLTVVQPQEQFDVNITVYPCGKSIYGVEYYLHYNTSVVRAETQNKGPFLGDAGETMIVTDEIDHTNGIVSYAETRKVPGGVTENGTVARIHFIAIGACGATSPLDLFDVIIVDENKVEIPSVLIIDGNVTISENKPPVANGTSKHRVNNVAKKYQSTAVLCSCSYDPDYPNKGGNITYIRWAFGDGQYGTSEGLPVDNCTCKEHKYESWQWENGHYVPFNATLTVTDDGCPELSNATEFDVTVYIAGDADGDGEVNIIDAVWVGKHWRGECSTTNPCANCTGYLWDGAQVDGADLNNDCEINILDAVVVGANWRHVAW